MLEQHQQYPDSWLTLLKWVAIASMTLDHCNRFLLSEAGAIAPGLGRLAMPLFVFVLAYNLARMPVNKMPKLVFRLFAFGVLATPAYLAVGATSKYGWWPLNILFTFMTLTTVVWLLSVKTDSKWKTVVYRFSAIILFLVLGVIVEYFWVGLGLGLSIWAYFRLAKITIWGRALPFAVAAWFVLLNDMNGNWWALVAFALVATGWLVPADKVKLPRCKWFFYWFYPAHLAVIWVLVKIFP
ncbi:TraX family protein [Marinobacter sp. ELB17]|uniref:TraX family protein n=1 Tax=Marinobacter sp. ELB17 TaxID=270374 RepID=UPI0000F3B3B6|nr:TraX family protein [Marinobacter sp. ELB17]EAZ98345.1 TraX [Marinobacter sp. ELB17]